MQADSSLHDTMVTVSAGPGPAVVEGVNEQLYIAAGVNVVRTIVSSIVMAVGRFGTVTSSEIHSIVYVTIPLGTAGGSQVNDILSGVS